MKKSWDYHSIVKSDNVRVGRYIIILGNTTMEKSYLITITANTLELLKCKLKIKTAAPSSL